ncbi:hypothetical protein ACVWYF_001689 [Hymenobacter sp. UYAg731]
MSRFLFIFFALFSTAAAAQPRLNAALKHELDSIYVLDQHYRELISAASTPRGVDSVARQMGITGPELSNYLIGKMLMTDSSNMRCVARIIRQHGYPGRALVGTPANEAAFYVIQHSNAIPRYLPLVKQAAETGELPFRLYAMMLDRQLMYEGKEQVYGTQGRFFTIPNPATGQPQSVKIIWPIKDAAGVNARRRKAGFDQTVEENAQRLGIPYRPLTLTEVNKMQKQ